MYRLTFNLVGFLILTGCSVKGPLISQPEIPPLFKDSVTVTINKKQSIIDSSEVIRDIDYQVKSRSTFVISVPTDYVKESANKETKNIRDAESLQVTNRNTELYNTSGYFNYAEQQIEKSLIRLGYRVIDRSKFEAKLREQRIIIEAYSTSGNTDKRIDTSAFDQLRDISELIRAAQNGEVRSNYILQINQLKLKKKLITINLTKFSDIEIFKDKYPAVANKVPKYYQFPEYSVTFNAKLIDVLSGRIIWLGSHEVNSRNILEKNIELTMTMRKFVTNYDDVTKFIAFQNTNKQRKNRGKAQIKLPEWDYEYRFDMDVTPNLNELDSKNNDELRAQDQDSKEKFLNHRDQLLKLVTSMLINTLKSSW